MIVGRVVVGEPGGTGLEGAVIEIDTSFADEATAPTTTSVRSRDDGSFVAVLETGLVRIMVLRLSTADGVSITRATLDTDVEDPDSFHDVGTLVAPADQGALALRPRPSAPTPRPRATGRVVDAGGECSLHCLQVLLEVRLADTGSFRALAVARTGRSGRWFVDYAKPAAPIVAARAVIPGVRRPLEVPVTDDGLLASEALLVIELPEAEHAHETAGCDCGNADLPRQPDQWELADESATYSADLGGGCVSFTTPNRAIEEFDFWTVVRTSQPTVRAGLSGERRDLADFALDWDADAPLFEATTAAHGHLLHFRQTWYADGYSLGDLLYSLPLAPGQKKLISVVEWERAERTGRSETSVYTEEVAADMRRGRDINDVVNAALSENSRGGSTSSTWGVGTGTGGAGNGSYQGFNFGALFGISGGYSRADSESWQNSSRTLSSSAMNSLRDRVLQSASATRGVRSTVVTEVTQRESVRAETDVVANRNRCHAMTMQYFEVLRHYQMRHELVEVKECVFVPLPMRPFERPTILRWRDGIAAYLLKRELAGALDAMQRVETHWDGLSVPLDRYADEPIVEISGEFEIEFQAYPPPLPDPDTPEALAGSLEQSAIGVIASLFFPPAAAILPVHVHNAAAATVRDLRAEATAALRHRKFHRDVMPRFVADFVDALTLVVERPDAAGPVTLPEVDFSLVARYQPDRRLLVSFRAPVSGITRADVRALRIEASRGVPDAVRCLVRSLTAEYATSSFSRRLVSAPRLNDDLDGARLTIVAEGLLFRVGPADESTADPVRVFTPLDAWERRRPRDEDQRLATRLVEHLEQHREYYHHAIWWTMDPNRRHLLLDGYLAPNGGGRSLAQVVENRVIGIVGNTLVLPVAPGVHLDPRLSVAAPEPREGEIEQPTAAADDPTGLFAYYAPTTPVPPARVSLPTRGVFAEAVMGECNACERIDDSRLQRWEDYPLDEPPAIGVASLDTRRAEPVPATPTPLPTPLVSIQQPPAAPDPTDVAAAYQLLGMQAFRDMAGLSGTQANAAATYKQNLDAALAYGKEAAELAKQAGMMANKDRAFDAVDRAEESGAITSAEAHDLRLSGLKKLVGDGGDGGDESGAARKRLDVVEKAGKDGTVDTETAQRLAGRILEGLARGRTETDPVKDAAAAQIATMPSGSVTSVEVSDEDGSTSVESRPTGSRPLQAGFDALHVWINAFIPGEVEGVTRPRPGHPDESLVGGIPLVGDCFATDDRTFSSAWGASSRMRSWIAVDFSGQVPAEIDHSHDCDPTVEIDCESGEEDQRDRGQTDRMRWTLAGRSTTDLVQITYRGEAKNPLVPGAWDIDMHGTVLVDPLERELRFVGAVDDFPAFEMYCRVDEGPTLTVFRAAPVPGASPAVGLAGGAKRTLDETIRF